MIDKLQIPPIRTRLDEGTGQPAGLNAATGRTAKEWYLFWRDSGDQINRNRIKLDGLITSGMQADRPDAEAMPEGALYIATDHGNAVYQNQDGAWVEVAPQTPWRQNIDGAGFKLTGAGNIGLGTTTVPIYNSLAGRAYLTIEGTTDSGVLELATKAADADASQVGQVAFTDPINNQTDKRLAVITAWRSGTTAANRGSYMRFDTRPDAGTVPVERMRINNAGNVGIGTATIPVGSSALASRAYLTIKGSSDIGVIELATALADADGTGIGQVCFSDTLNNQTDKRMGIINLVRHGTTANNRGSAMTFSTRADGAAGFTERVRIDNQGRLGIATGSPQYQLDVSGDINVSGVFRKAGVSGFTGTVALAKLTAGGLNGSLTVSGGIITGYVAPT